MKRSRFSEEQIVYALLQAEGGTPVGDLCRELGSAGAWISCMIPWPPDGRFGS